MKRALGAGALAVGCALSVPASAGELGDLLRASLDHPAIGASRLRSESAQAGLSAERSRFWGAGAAFTDISRYEDQRFVGVLSPTALLAPPFARDLTRYGLAYSIPVDLTGAVRASREAAAHNLAAAQLAERQTTLLKLADTVTAYVQLQSLMRQQRVLSVQRERVAQTFERVARQVEIQQSSTSELKLAEAELGKLRSEEARLAGAIELALAQLVESSGRRLTPASPDIRIPDWDIALPESPLPVAEVEEQARAAQAQARAQQRALWPNLSAAADYTQFEGNSHSTDAWSVGARINLPIDPAGWRRAGAAQAQAGAALQASLAARRQTERDWVNLAAAYKSALADAEALRTEISAREEVVRVQAELQRVGMASLEDFLSQQRDLLDAESRLGAAEAQAVMSWAAAQVLAGTDLDRFIATIDSAR